MGVEPDSVPDPRIDAQVARQALALPRDLAPESAEPWVSLGHARHRAETRRPSPAIAQGARAASATGASGRASVTAVNSQVSARDALLRLREGNRRFADNVRSLDSLLSHTRRAEMASAQQPFAIVLGCSDSRVPAEVVFDQGLGDLFVIRVAGNIVAPSQVGSIEFAAARYGTRLVVVMGHSQCGVILATLESMETPSATESRNLLAIVDRVRPSIEPLVKTDLVHDRQSLIRAAVRANVRASANHLRHGSEMLEQLIARHGLVVVGAEYSLDTGEVDFFDGCPD
jgi:carbonic anhydrase